MSGWSAVCDVHVRECITVNVSGWWGSEVAAAWPRWCLGATAVLWHVEVGSGHSEPHRGPSAVTIAPHLVLLWKRGPLHQSTRLLNPLWLVSSAWRGTETPWKRHRHIITAQNIRLFLHKQWIKQCGCQSPGYKVMWSWRQLSQRTH